MIDQRKTDTKRHDANAKAVPLTRLLLLAFLTLCVALFACACGDDEEPAATATAVVTETPPAATEIT